MIDLENENKSQHLSALVNALEEEKYQEEKNPKQLKLWLHDL